MSEREPAWLLRETLIAAHRLLIAEHGGMHGMRDEGLLDSALARPKNQFAYGDDDICVLAACYAVGIAKNHPFLDGNKRAAFVAAYVFLERNGFVLDADEAETVVVMTGVAAGMVRETDLAKWFRAHIAASK